MSTITMVSQTEQVEEQKYQCEKCSQMVFKDNRYEHNCLHHTIGKMPDTFKCKCGRIYIISNCQKVHQELAEQINLNKMLDNQFKQKIENYGQLKSSIVAPQKLLSMRK